MNAQRGGFLSRMSINAKLMLNSVVALILACFCVSFILIANTGALLRENSLHQSEQELAGIIAGYTGAVTRQYEATRELAEFQPLANFLEKEHETAYSSYLEFSDTVWPWLEWLRRSNKELDLKVYLDGQYVSISSITGGKLSFLRTREWYEEATSLQNPLRAAFARTVIGSRYTSALIYYRNVWDAERGETKRAIVVSQSSDSLRKDIRVKNSRYYLINEEDRIISSNDNNAVGEALSSVPGGALLESDQIESGDTTFLNGVEYYIRMESFHPDDAGIPKGWRILYLQDFTEIAESIRAQTRRSAQICIGIVLGTAALALSVSHNITSRLNLLMKKISALTRGDFSMEIDIPGRDEISRINARFDAMRDRIHQLIQDMESAYRDKVSYERRQKELVMSWRDTEYQVLRAQINPHYLFNTLESIRMSLLIDGEREGARIMRIFADTMREYMDVDRLYASLGEELRFLGYYMEIQRFRMGERVQYVQTVPEELLETEVPRLILQPLVENAINHGIDPKVEGGYVRLEALCDHDRLLLRVTDNGVGMSEAQLLSLRASLLSDSDSGRHLALKNIHRRLKLLFGEESELTIESIEGRGSIVTVRMPLAKKGDGENV